MTERPSNIEILWGQYEALKPLLFAHLRYTDPALFCEIVQPQECPYIARDENI